MGLSRIFREDILLEALPNNISVKLPVIVHKLGNTIRGKLFNCCQALANLGLDNFIANYNSIQCVCENSKFTDPHHIHVITGYLSVVGHDLLRKFMQQGLNTGI